MWLDEWDDHFSRDQTLAGLHWLKDRGFYLRGHVFVWPGRQNLPKAVTALLGTPRQGEIPAMVLDHIRDEARATRGLLQEWDVLNEPYTNHDLMDVFGREIMPTWFKVAHEELPGVALFLNDFSNHDAVTSADHVAHFEQTARYLLDQGAPLTGLGLQAHFNGQPNPPEHILAVLDRYAAQFHLPVRFTEFDVSTRDEELQADYTRDFLILAFSHPSVVGVQLWGFWENAHWIPAAAMYRADWSEKPNAKVYKSLVLDQWRTRLGGATDAKGGFSGRGFYGEYVVIVEAGGRRVEQEFTLSPGAGACGRGVGGAAMNHRAWLFPIGIFLCGAPAVLAALGGESLLADASAPGAADPGRRRGCRRPFSFRPGIGPECGARPATCRRMSSVSPDGNRCSRPTGRAPVRAVIMVGTIGKSPLIDGLDRERQARRDRHPRGMGVICDPDGRGAHAGR